MHPETMVGYELAVDHETAADVVQDDTPNLPTVPVRVEGIAMVQPLPGRGGGETRPELLVDGAVARKVLNQDPMRRKAQLISSDYKLYIGTSQAGCTATTGILWPINVRFVWESDNELWAMAAESGHNSTVAVISERWAD